MSNSYFKLTDAERTVWCATDRVRNIADAAGMLSRAFSASGAEETVRQLMEFEPMGLRPAAMKDVLADTNELRSPPPGGVLAEVDIASDRVKILNRSERGDSMTETAAPLSRLMAIHDMSLAQDTLDIDTFVSMLYHHCSMRVLPVPDRQTEGPAVQQMM